MTNQTEDKTERARKQARAKLDSIVEMVDRLEHCQDCTGDEDCQAKDEDILSGLGLWSKDTKPPTDEEREQYHDEDEARERIQENALSVEVRADWHQPGGEDTKPTEYKILLCTGGPAVRIIGDLNEYQEPETARLEYQDWFTPWEKYRDTTSEEDDKLLTYARQFYFGE